MTSYVGEKKKRLPSNILSFFAPYLKMYQKEFVMKSFLIGLETLCFVFLSDQVNAEMRSKCQISFSPQMSNTSESLKGYVQIYIHFYEMPGRCYWNK